MLYGSDPRGGGGGIKSGGLDLVNLRGEVAVHEVGHEVEVEELPHGDVADSGDEGDQNAAGEGAAERDLAGEIVVPVAADAEVDQQERRHHDGVAESHAVAGADLVCEEKRAAHKDGDDEAGDEAEGEDDFFHVRLLVRVRMELLCGTTGPDVVILSDDFAGMERKSCFRVTRSGQEAQFFAALNGLGAAGGAELVEDAGTVRLDGVLRNEKLRGDLAIAEAAGDQVEDFKLACGDAEGLLAVRIGGKRFKDAGFRGDGHFPDHHGFADDFAIARDAEAEPDAESGEEDGDEGAVELDGVLDDDEAVLGVLESGDEEPANETEDEDVALHDVVVKKYNGDGEKVVCTRGRGER
jgi:hypothetical protein